MEEVEVEQTRATLGNIAKKLSDEALKDTYVEIQYLVESWLDEYERSIFDGKTLQELFEENI